MNNNTDHIGNETLHKAKATLDDLLAVSNDLSDGDLSDFYSMQSDRQPSDVFPNALDETTYTIKYGSRVLAVGGHGQGGVWFVTTNAVALLSKAGRFRFYRILKAHLVWIKSEATGVTLTNWVSVGNHAHVRLLESLGATFQADCGISPAGFPFKQFWL